MSANERSQLPSHPTDSTSTSLLQRLRAREELAWGRMMELYRPLVCAWLRRRGVAAGDIDDVCQEVFAAVSAGLGRFERTADRGTFRGWLRRIAYHKTADYFRRRAAEPQAAGGTEMQIRLSETPDKADEPTPPSPEEDKLETQILSRRALEMIRNEFEDRTWRAFWKVTVDARAPKDVAAELGMSPGAVRQAKYKVLRRLRSELGELLE